MKLDSSTGTLYLSFTFTDQTFNLLFLNGKFFKVKQKHKFSRNYFVIRIKILRVSIL